MQMAWQRLVALYAVTPVTACKYFHATRMADVSVVNEFLYIDFFAGDTFFAVWHQNDFFI